MAVTLHTENVGAAHDHLARHGFEPSDISETEILVETGNGPLLQKFRWLRLAPKTTPCMYFMLVQQMTPENMRRDAWLHHPNG